MAAAKTTETKSETPQQAQKEEVNAKNIWSIERCRKAARRFATVEAWAKGAPSSYKAANSHGWVAECTSHMGKVVDLSKRKSAPGRPFAKSA